MHIRSNNTYINRSPDLYLNTIKGALLTQEERENEVSRPNFETEIPYQLLCKSARRPYYATPGSVGLDLYSPHDAIVEPGEQECLPLGVALKTPPGTYLRLTTRSSLGSRAIEVGAGVIDADYRGEIIAIVYNFSDRPLYIRSGSAIAQGIITPYLRRQPVEVKYLGEGARVWGLGRDLERGAIKAQNIGKNLRFNDEVSVVYEDEKDIVKIWKQPLPKFEGPQGLELTIGNLKASSVLEASIQKEIAEDRLGACSRVIKLHDAITEHMQPEEANKVWRTFSNSIRDLEAARVKGLEIEKAIEDAKKEDA